MRIEKQVLLSRLSDSEADTYRETLFTLQHEKNWTEQQLLAVHQELFTKDNPLQALRLFVYGPIIPNYHR